MKRQGKDDLSEPAKRYSFDGVNNIPPPSSPQNYYQMSFYNGVQRNNHNSGYSSQIGPLSVMDHNSYNMYAAQATNHWNYLPTPAPSIVFDPSQPPPPLPSEINKLKTSSQNPMSRQPKSHIPTHVPPPNLNSRSHMPPLPALPPQHSPAPSTNLPPPHTPHLNSIPPLLSIPSLSLQASSSPAPPTNIPLQHPPPYLHSLSPSNLQQGVFSSGMGNRKPGRGSYMGGGPDKLNNRRNMYNSKSNTPSTRKDQISVKSPARLNAFSYMDHTNDSLMGGSGTPGVNDATDKSNGNREPHSIVINKKSKRKPMSTRYVSRIEWNREDALKVIALEKQYNKLQRTAMLILKFPDPELNKEIVKSYSPLIETVHFQQPSTPRYCFVQLAEGADIEKVKEEINKIPFGAGTVLAENKTHQCDDNQQVTPEEIDPYTLYVGNLPTKITVKTVKQHFPNAIRIDIGYAQRMKYTRYAFVRYADVEKSMEAYKETFNMLIESRSIIVRFRRQKSSIGLPGEVRTPNSKRNAQTTDNPEIDNIDAPDILHDTYLEHIEQLNQEYDAISNSDDENSRDVEIIGESFESKEHILEDSKQFFQNRRNGDQNGEYFDEHDLSEEESPVVPNRPIKTERFDPNEDCSQYTDSGLLGSRVKEEPLDDDALLEQADMYDDMEDDELDCEPEEEDDIIQNEFNQSVVSSKANEDKNWEEIRQKELSQKEEKPPIVLPSPKGKSKAEENTLRNDEKKQNDELDDLFSSMNPEDEDEEF